MFNWNKFPYSNMQQLNLSWVINTVKELASNFVSLFSKVETLEDTINAITGSIESDYTSIEAFKDLVIDFGLETEDWSPAIQKTLDVHKNAYIPFIIEGMYTAGTYPVGNTISMGRGQRLKGEGGASYSNANTGEIKVQIYHNPAAQGNLFEANQDDLLFTYVADIEISDLLLIGSTHSLNAISLDRAQRARVENVAIKDLFNAGIRIDGQISSEYKNIYMQNIVENAVLFEGGLSTTVTLDRVWVQTCNIGVKAETGTCLGVVMRDMIVEGGDVGFDIYKENVISLFAPFTENIPDDGTASSIFKVGVNGVAAAVPNTIVNVYGGFIYGYNGATHADSLAFECDNARMVNVEGCEIARVGQGFSNTVNTLALSVIGCFGLSTTLLGSKILNPANVVDIESNLIKSRRLILANNGASLSWEALQEYAYTDEDFVIKRNNVKPFMIDAENNIKLNAETPIGTMKGVTIVGNATLSPTYLDVIENASVLYSEDVQGTDRPKIMSGGTYKYKTTIGMKGETSTRPDPTLPGLEDGDMFYNTTTRTLNFYNASTTSWVDIDGVTV